MYMTDSDDAVPICYTEACSAVGDGAAELYGGHEIIRDQTQLDYVNNASIYSQLNPYIKSGGLWKCPSDSSCPTTPTIGKRYTSYHYRHVLSAPFAPIYQDPKIWWYRKVWHTSDLTSPSRTFAFNELSPFHDYRIVNNLPWMATGKGWAMDSKMNFIFMDGHAKTYPVDKLLVRAPWATDTGYDYHWSRAVDGVELTDLAE